MKTKELICVSCPIGCAVTVTLDDNNEVVSVTGNTCKRGDSYARQECTHPERMLTSTVKVTGSRLPVVPVKSAKPVPKELLLDCMQEINRVTVQAPVHIGDVAEEVRMIVGDRCHDEDVKIIQKEVVLVFAGFEDESPIARMIGAVGVLEKRSVYGPCRQSRLFRQIGGDGARRALAMRATHSDGDPVTAEPCKHLGIRQHVDAARKGLVDGTWRSLSISRGIDKDIYIIRQRRAKREYPERRDDVACVEVLLDILAFDMVSAKGQIAGQMAHAGSFDPHKVILHSRSSG